MKLIRSFGIILLVFAIVMNAGWLPVPKVNADNDASNGILLSMSSDVATVKTGKTFTYTISFSFSDLAAHGFDFTKMKLVLPLSADVEYVSYVPISIISGVTQTGSNLEFAFDPAGPAPGTSYNLQVNVQFKPYVTPDGTNITTTSTIIKREAAPTPDTTLDTSNPVTVIGEASADWVLKKERVAPLPDPMVDGEVQYRILLDNNQSNTSIGILDIENVVVKDILPPEAEFVSASPAPSSAPAVGSSGIITWSLPGTIRDDTFFYVTVRYPATKIVPANLGVDVTNTATVDYNPIGKSPTMKADSVSHHFTATPDDTGPGGFYKHRDDRQKEITPGQNVKFYVGGFRNWSNTIYSDAVIEDMTPTKDNAGNAVDLDLKSIRTATFNDAISSYDVYYTTTSTPTAGDWQLWQNVNSAVPTDLNVSALPLSGGEHVMGIQYRFPSTLPVMFSQVTEFVTTYTLRAGSPIVKGNHITNTAKLSYTFEGNAKTKADSADVWVYIDRPLVRLDKTRVGSGPYVPSNDAGDKFVEFDLKVSNTDLSSDLFHDPIVIDKLPKWLTYDSWKIVDQSGFDPKAAGHAIDLDPLVVPVTKNAVGETLLRWIFPAGTNMPINSFFTIRVKAKIDKYTPATTYTNIAGVTSNVDLYFNDYFFDTKPDPSDYDGDAKTNDIFIYSSADVTVNKVSELGSYKRVRGELDSDWMLGILPDGCTMNTACDQLANTTEGGRVDYKLTVKNNSNHDVDHVVVVDPLPRIGDGGALLGARGSTWGTVLTAPLAANPNYTVQYNTLPNVKFSTAPGWSTTPPDDLTTVTALKFVFNPAFTLVPGQEVPIQWTMMAPVGTVVDKIAWNSFAHQAKEVGSGSAMLPAEPPKVGVHIRPDNGLKIGNYVWVDLNKNGLQDDGETGVNGVKVELYQADGVTPYTKDFKDDGVTQHIPVTTVTGPDKDGKPGYYLFPNLPAGDYTARFHLPTQLPEAYKYTGDGNAYSNAAHHFTAWTQKSAGGDAAIDSNIGGAGTTSSVTPFVTDVIHLTNADDLTIDAGLDPPLGEIGDFVWYDANGNGIQDVGEAGIPGQTIKLYEYTGGAWSPKSTTTTNASGNYLFTGLLPGKYKVAFPTNLNYDTDGNAGTPDEKVILTKRLQGNDRPLDSNVYDVVSALTYDNLPTGSKTFGFSEAIDLQLGEMNHTIDAGYLLPVKLGDYVWYDNDADGTQNTGDMAAQNVEVQLLNGSGIAVKGDNGINLKAITDASGNYLFKDLLPGDYQVQFVLPGGYGFTRKGLGGDATKDSNVNRSVNNSPTLQTTGKTDKITTVSSPGASDMTIDAGLVKLVSLGDFVWNDKNQNGVQDAGESGIDGSDVKLYYDSDSTTVVYRTATTAGGGKYQFDNLYPGKYTVEFKRPNGYLFSSKQQGGDTTKDSNVIVPATPSTATAKTDQITLLGSDDMTIDAGMYELASIGDKIWVDSNDNGIQDGGEPALAGVKIELFKADGVTSVTDGYNATVGAVTTAANGLYTFSNLLPGTYKVKFTLPNEYWYAKLNQGADPAKDSDAIADVVNPKVALTSVITLTAGQHDDTIDAGALSLASIGDTVWHDLNGNGIQDGGEPGKNGITVELFEADGVTAVTTDAYGTMISPATTDANGKYLFSNLKSGTYKVKFSKPAGFEFTNKNAASATAANDSDANSLTGMSDAIVLTWGTSNMTIDAGLVDRVKLGDTVWYDKNGDGVQDAVGEPGVPSVTVELYDGNDLSNKLASKTTDANGNYEFDMLWPGDYVVKFILPDDSYIFSPKNQGGDSAKDSDADQATGMTSKITLLSGVSNMTIDAGIVEKVSLGDTVWVDTNNNGIQDGGEVGFAGVKVHLLDKDGNAITVGGTEVTVTTDSNGKYLFDKLAPGKYKVSFDLPAGYMFAKKNAAGSTAANDSDVDATGVTDVINLPPYSHDMTVDAGLVKLASLGDYVWMDRNLNGIQDAGENGVSGVTVRLLDENGDPVKVGGVEVTTTTDVDGFYLFDNLVPGKYIVQFDPSPAASYVMTQEGKGTAATGSDANETTRRTAVITLAPGENNRDIDAGVIKLVNLGDTVWVDDNVIGVQDGEAVNAAAAGITVHLLDAAGNPVLNGVTPVTATTDANGKYLFSNLYPGSYKVKFELPTGYLFTRKTVTGTGITTANDSNVDENGITNTIVLVAGNDDMTVDAGIVLPASIGNFVWEDTNSNGKQDPGEKGRNDITVELYDDNGTLLETTKTADNGGTPGYYIFTNLVPGTYKVKFKAPGGYMFSTKNVPAATPALDSDAGLDGSTDAITLAPGENNLDIDAGIVLIPAVPLVSLGDFVWIDTNSDGIQDTDEAGLNGVTVELYNQYNALIATQTTVNDNNGKPGYYKFKDLLTGQYSVKFILPHGYMFTVGAKGDNRQVDSNAAADGTTGSILLLSSDYSIDAGLIPLGSIGDYVWIDTNANGKQDAGEKGLNGVTVTLYDSNGAQLASTVTANDGSGAPGYYLFTELKPGKYTVKFDLPKGYTFTKQSAIGTTAANDSDAKSDGATDSIELDSGANIRTIDAGFVPVAKPKPPESGGGKEPTTGGGKGTGTGTGTGNGGTGSGQGHNGSPGKGGDGSSKGGPGSASHNGTSGGEGTLPKTGETPPVAPLYGYGLVVVGVVLLAVRLRLKKSAKQPPSQ
ncbi:SdrD B-like domain-containing protein [Cohnella soli]|uniref:SdrD B-like domain-containing protein n=1 Tax=Cohnella soli TaxID=425005 RepID=A0ABW0I3V8_9BACL